MRMANMRQTFYLLLGAISLTISNEAAAQLPANPWAVQPEVKAQARTSTTQGTAGADVGHISAPTSERVYIPSIKYAPINAEAEAPTYKPAVSVGAKSNSSGAYALGRASNSSYAVPQAVSDTRSTSSASNQVGGNWRGSGQFGKLGYTGQVTTYDKAQGQEMIAPEVNNTNMNIMVQHLRDLGYRIPSSYDNKFSNFLEDYSSDLHTAYGRLGHMNNPVDKMFTGILDALEGFTGLDAGNLMFNSIDLIKRD